MKTMIITGGSSGIGRAAAELFASKGYKVYELSRHGVDNGTITHIDCDITQQEMCKCAVKQVVADAGRIDVLISNAGMGISGAIEFTKTEDICRQMDVNFMGAVNITQAALPFMRSLSHLAPSSQKRGRGHVAPKIIFVSSVMGVYGLPFQAFYSASKFAINGFAQALANEVRPFGIKVAVLMPGDVKTGFTNARKKEVEGADVYPHVIKAVEQMEHDEQNGISPVRMAEKLLALAESNSPAAHSTVGLMYKAFLFLGKLLPQKLITYIIGKMY